MWTEMPACEELAVTSLPTRKLCEIMQICGVKLGDFGKRVAVRVDFAHTVVALARALVLATPE